jgi:phage terminase large subunit-like protein
VALSLADEIGRLSPEDMEEWIRSTPRPVLEVVAKRPWWWLRRPEQKCPAGFDWLIWLILSGRGWGKTKTGAETLLDWMIAIPVWDGIPTEWAIIGETVRDAREICMLGPSGMIRALEHRGLVEGQHYIYNRSLGVVVLLPNTHPSCQGQKIHVQGADDADVGRGLNLSGAWMDEFAKWPYPTASWSEGIMPSLRIGPHPQVVITTTPKPIKMLKDWASRTDGSVQVTRGSTFDNALNLSPVALAELQKRYEGTRIGRQELHGELLDDVEGALWQRSQIDADRVIVRQVELARIVVAVDPAVTSGENADETGIMVMGLGVDGHGYLLRDYSCRTTPLAWATKVVEAYREFEANEVVIEVNNGGEALTALLRTVEANLPVTEIHAKKSKRVRAEPISALCEQHRIHHVGRFDTLEDQLVSWTPELVESPDRMDAYVYAALALFETGDSAGFLAALAAKCERCGTPLTNGFCLICSTRG